ncbi:MAG: hypothetical protein ABSE17_04530 [Candidatus Levyibacteriota bacterium]|jgi:hypothetical protein
MKQERVILSFVAVLIGLLAAGLAFYFYQSTKTISSSNQITVNAPTPTPTPKPAVYLSLSSPDDEIVVGNSTLTVSGKTNPNATIIIYTADGQQVIQPSNQGDFSTTLTLDDGENLLKLTSILPGGETNTVQRTVTYSTEDF